MEVETMIITPTIAAEMLKHNTLNRHLNMGHVEKLARDMKKGWWRENGEPICFDTRGRLINGQHRLHAIIKSSKSFEFVVVTVSPENGDIYDVGNKRNAADIMKLSCDETMIPFADSTTCAVSRKLLFYNGVSKPTTTEVILNIKRNIECFEFLKTSGLYSNSKAGKRQAKVANATVSASCLSAYQSGYNEETLRRFIGVLIKGIATTEAEMGVLPLRDFIISTTTTKGGKALEKDYYMKVQQGLYNFERGLLPTRAVAAKAIKYKWTIKEDSDD